MEQFLVIVERIVIFSVLVSALYALVALGFTMIFGVGRVLNLAHGALLMVGAYTAWFAQRLGLELYLAAGLAVVVCALLAVALYQGLIRHVQHSVIITLIATLACALLLEEIVKIFFTTTPQILQPFISGSVIFHQTTIISNRILAFGASWAAILLFWIFVHRTRWGKVILATAQDQEGAALVGINVRHVYTVTWALSGALAGLAGVFFASWVNLSPFMWRDPLIISFAIVVVGGLGSLKGSIVAAYLIGFLEVFMTYSPSIRFCADFRCFEFLGPSWVGVPSLMMLVLILFLKPSGLFGRAHG
ncbi:branched-chain amino acid ABC transporter permease [Candidatus Acetothermia bacterium]|jgi:branched-chain amino acid transport system permease protein|nr:branched-chain amino acid ABC transporter permease [Candidatus Acetothermia bacterium]MCI2432691.1 branched-chain amino acid ABC transporter permease [Candidatus Acetothermia bacterium]MCI2436079.1 branched-chain amino acid ABC transporter permease [Candidatus Acetothermia bacterium]